MVGLEGNGQCREAQFYYHDFLQNRGVVPAPVADHIDGCTHCQAQVERLGRMLGQAAAAGNPHRSNHSHELISELQSHFDHMGEQITCSQVKRYLPGLLFDHIRIPTPITVHVDQCERCTEDLEHLRSLALTQEQLVRLTALYAEPAQADASLCRQVKLMLADIDDLSLEDTPAHLAGHIRSCPQCRERVYEARQDLLYRCQEHSSADSRVGCGRIVGADIFDFVVLPDASTSAAAVPGGWHEAVAEHVFSCPQCLAKVQSMHRVIYGAAERADSGVATVYTPATAGTTASKKNLRSYAAYPIDVQLLGGRPKPVRKRARLRGGALMVALKRQLRSRRLRTLVPATAVSVVMAVLIGIYIISSESALGLNVHQINGMIASVRNVHIKSLGWDGALIRELWASKSVEFAAQKTPTQMEVWDNREHKKITVGQFESSIESIMTTNAAGMDDAATAKIRNQLDLKTDGIPADAELHRRVSAADANNPAIEEYEIIFPSPDQGDLPVMNRRILSVDIATQLPLKSELYQRQTPECPWQLQTTKVYEYPTDKQMHQRFDKYLKR
jgi:hypothetical protein